MNLRTFVLFIPFILLFACKTGKHTHYSSASDDFVRMYAGNEDYTKSAKEAIDSVISILNRDTVMDLQINIYNFHGGVYTQKSKLTKKHDNLNISTAVVGMDGKHTYRDTSFKTGIFIAELTNWQFMRNTRLPSPEIFKKSSLNIQVKSVCLQRERPGGSCQYCEIPMAFAWPY